MPQKPDDHRICFIGDSFVQGTSDPLCLGWTGRLAQRAVANGFRLTHYNLGIRRNTSRDIATRWLAECTARLPAGCVPHAVFSFGVNDTMMENGARRIEEAESIANFRIIVQEAASRYAVLAVGPPPMPDDAHLQRIAQLDRQFALHAAECRIPYLSVWQALRDDAHWLDEARADDGAHPGRRGYDRLAALVEEWDKWWFKK